jgi:hypothetical protein
MKKTETARQVLKTYRPPTLVKAERLIDVTGQQRAPVVVSGRAAPVLG